MARRAISFRSLPWAAAGAAVCLISVGGFQLWQTAAAHGQAAAGQRAAAAAWSSASPHAPDADSQEAREQGAGEQGAVQAIARLSDALRGLDVYVMPDADWDSLGDGPGLFAGVAPGEPGMSVIAGHRETHFAFLRELAVGDLITVEHPDGRGAQFQVTDARVVDGRMVAVGGPVAPDAPAELMLVTCYPFDTSEVGPERYVVTLAAM